MMEIRPTNRYLPTYYAACETMKTFCAAVDQVIKDAWVYMIQVFPVYMAYRNDLAFDPVTKTFNPIDVDTKTLLEQLLGLPVGIKAEDSGKLLMVLLLIRQLFARPYTLAGCNEFLTAYSALMDITAKFTCHIEAANVFVVEYIDAYGSAKKSHVAFVASLFERIIPATYAVRIDYIRVAWNTHSGKTWKDCADRGATWDAFAHGGI